MDRRILIAIALLVLLVGGAALALQNVKVSPLEGDLLLQLEGAGRVGIVSEDPSFVDGVAPRGAELVRVPLPSLDGNDVQELLAEMAEAELDMLLVDGRGGGPASSVRSEASLGQHLRAYARVPGLRGVYLTPTAALFAPGIGASLDEASRVVLPRVARGLLAGRSPPRVSSFPEPIRRIRSVEVMVLLRDGGRARLWRSARGSSIGRALNTAAVVARQRWTEREQAMGGALDERLGELEIEVSLLEEDGTLGSTAPGFVERVFDDGHGVAYERPGAWRYLLPEATARAGEGSAVKAYEKLFQDNALPPTALRRAGMRFYRLVVSVLGSSAPERGLGGVPSSQLPDPGRLGRDALPGALDP